MQLAFTTNAPTEGGHARVRDPKRKAQVHTTTSQYTVDLAREVSLHWLAGPSIAAGRVQHQPPAIARLQGRLRLLLLWPVCTHCEHNRLGDQNLGAREHTSASSVPLSTTTS